MFTEVPKQKDLTKYQKETLLLFDYHIQYLIWHRHFQRPDSIENSLLDVLKLYLPRKEMRLLKNCTKYFTICKISVTEVLSEADSGFLKMGFKCRMGGGCMGQSFQEFPTS